jgi:hypothetical protein
LTIGILISCAGWQLFKKYRETKMDKCLSEEDNKYANFSTQNQAAN